MVGGGIFYYGVAKTIELLNQVLKYSLKTNSWLAPSPFSKLFITQ
jgi:hypothetical protein